MARISADGKYVLVKPGEQLNISQFQGQFQGQNGGSGSNTNGSNNSGTYNHKIFNQTLIEKNFSSLGLNQSSFNIEQNSFNGFSYVDTSLAINLDKFTNPLSNWNNILDKTNFQLSNPMQDAIKHLGNARNHASPLAFDLDGDGIETTNLNDGSVFFDIKNTGFANKIGWINSDDGLLALDRNNNSQIDNRNFI